MRAVRVVEQSQVGDDDRIDAVLRGAVDGARPAAPGSGLRIGVEREQHLDVAGSNEQLISGSGS